MRHFLSATLILAAACKPDSEDPEEIEAEDALSGVYDVETVTCDGEEVPINVTATVTFDDTSYLEEWTFPDAECEVSLAGTSDVTDQQLTLQDVTVTCSDACQTEGLCDPIPCPVDQTYQYTLDGDELLLSFTQQGSEFACGPCGDGVPSTYLLVRTAAP